MAGYHRVTSGHKEVLRRQPALLQHGTGKQELLASSPSSGTWGFMHTFLRTVCLSFPSENKDWSCRVGSHCATPTRLHGSEVEGSEKAIGVGRRWFHGCAKPHPSVTFANVSGTSIAEWGYPVYYTKCSKCYYLPRGHITYVCIQCMQLMDLRDRVWAVETTVAELEERKETELHT